MGEAAIKGQRWWATPLVAAAAVVGNNRAWFVQFTGLLLLAEAVLNALIIRFVPCTMALLNFATDSLLTRQDGGEAP